MSDGNEMIECVMMTEWDDESGWWNGMDPAACDESCLPRLVLKSTTLKPVECSCMMNGSHLM